MKTKRFEVQTTWDRMMMPAVKVLETDEVALLAFDLEVASRAHSTICNPEGRAPVRVALYTRIRRVRRGVERWDLGELVKIWRNPAVRQ